MNCIGNFTVVNNWNQIGSADYFNGSCTTGLFKVPKNTFGVAYPVSGLAYGGVICYRKPDEIKEYVQQHLITPLIAGKTYYTSFYVSLSDRFTMAIKNVGVYFSVTQPTIVSNPYISVTPQVENQNGFLTDTTGWTKIDGYFTAQGGEEYITIGNFNSNIHTDTLYVGTNDPPPGNPDGAYYYIDSVSLYDSLDYVTNIKSHENKIKWNLYPNPNKGMMTLDYDLGNVSEAILNLYDVTGKLMNTYKLPSNKGTLQMNEQILQNGIYFYHIIVEGKSIKTNKIVIIK